ncbi:hypothetical protein QYE76_013468 [Lolium multiflorum]|uniref:Reverse transcriptase Ty1/copia-type domain-containing protein n=1 Tax=Lolium multiflorum TaxID=4521 RepID=A0AAD8TYX2_LOLMU|nr:hypothetical protein QYE76_013468 [Lolium multiflorum]
MASASKSLARLSLAGSNGASVPGRSGIAASVADQDQLPGVVVGDESADGSGRADVVNNLNDTNRDDRRAPAFILKGVPPELTRVLAFKATGQEAWEMIKTMRVGNERVRKVKADLQVLGDPIDERKAVFKILRTEPKPQRRWQRRLGKLYVATVEEPSSIDEALVQASWRNAMEEEMAYIRENNTWELSTLPASHCPISLKWVYKVKRNPAGNARRVWSRKEVYVQQPAGFVDNNNAGKVLKLNKALYGLRQAPRAWKAKLVASMSSLGFTRCELDHALYKRRNNGEFLVAGDLIITGTSDKEIEQFKLQMHELF